MANGVGQVHSSEFFATPLSPGLVAMTQWGEPAGPGVKRWNEPVEARYRDYSSCSWPSNKQQA